MLLGKETSGNLIKRLCLSMLLWALQSWPQPSSCCLPALFESPQFIHPVQPPSAPELLQQSYPTQQSYRIEGLGYGLGVQLKACGCFVS